MKADASDYGNRMEGPRENQSSIASYSLQVHTDYSLIIFEIDILYFHPHRTCNAGLDSQLPSSVQI